MDSHNVQRYVDKNGHARNEGDIQVNPGGPYPVDYGAIIPRKSECHNLLVPVCVSSSHIAFGSIRMEPVFMILGQSAATAASLCLDEEIAVQGLPYKKYSERLLADKQVLAIDSPGTFVPLSSLKGIVIDDTVAKLEGPWKKSGEAAGVHQGYLHDDGRRDGSCRAVFAATLAPGSYDIQVAYPPHSNRATNVAVTVTTPDETHKFTLNQRDAPNRGVFHNVGTLKLSGSISLSISNHDADGHVIADAVRFVKK